MSNEKKQTAVDFFYNEVWLCFSNKLSWTECDRLTKIKEQAKEMEKQQLMNSYWDGGIDIPNSLDCCQKYIKETYGGDK